MYVYIKLISQQKCKVKVTQVKAVLIQDKHLNINRYTLKDKVKTNTGI